MSFMVQWGLHPGDVLVLYSNRYITLALIPTMLYAKNIWKGTVVYPCCAESYFCLQMGLPLPAE